MPTPSTAKMDLLAKAVAPQEKALPPEGSRLSVHAAITRFAVFYERLRIAIDYKEEHLYRRTAIVRILKRQITLGGTPEEVALQCLRELIAARYLENNLYAETLTQEVSLIVKKYQEVKRIHSVNPHRDTWLLDCIAAEIDEKVIDQTEEKVFLNLLYEQVAEKVRFKDNELGDEERRLQIFIACLRLFFKADDALVSYKLLRIFEPRWIKSTDWESVHEMSLCLDATHERIQRILANPYQQKLQAAIKPWSVSLTVLRAALKEEPKKALDLLKDQGSLQKALERIAESRIQFSRARLKRGIIRAVIYLFFTKMLFAVLLEYPLEIWLYGEPHRIALVINGLFPVVLMAIVGAFMSPPVKENIATIVKGAQELLSVEGLPSKELRGQRKNSTLAAFLLGFGYVTTFVVTFSCLFWLLSFIGYTWVSMGIFVFFLCVVSFFAYRLRMGSKEYVAYEKPSEFFGLMMDFFSLPVLKVGRWLSETVSKFNLLVFIFDVFLEAPYKLFLQALEEWFYYMKEKKDQL